MIKEILRSETPEEFIRLDRDEALGTSNYSMFDNTIYHFPNHIDMEKELCRLNRQNEDLYFTGTFEGRKYYVGEIYNNGNHIYFLPLQDFVSKRVNSLKYIRLDIEYCHDDIYDPVEFYDVFKQLRAFYLDICNYRRVITGFDLYDEVDAEDYTKAAQSFENYKNSTRKVLNAFSGKKEDFYKLIESIESLAEAFYDFVNCRTPKEIVTDEEVYMTYTYTSSFYVDRTTRCYLYDDALLQKMIPDEN